MEIIDTGNGKGVAYYPMPMTWLAWVAFSPDGRLLAVGGGSFSPNGQVVVFETPTGTVAHTFEVGTNTARGRLLP